MSNRREKTFSIGDAAKIARVSQKQLRHWESKKYIPEADRIIYGERAFRRFSAEHIKIICKLKAYLDIGYTLPAAAKKAAENTEEKEDKQDA